MLFYVETYGCQMNEYDSRMIASILSASGHTETPYPLEADVVMVNTCSVRERAERRVFGRLRHLRGLIRPTASLGIVGCVAQRLGSSLLSEIDGLGFVVGTDCYDRLPRVLDAVRAGARAVEVGVRPKQIYEHRPLRTAASTSEFVTIMRGCNNFCSYCIVPHVRGRERSRPSASIVDEVAELVGLGARDVTLLGQNVNSYRDGEHDFADLLSVIDVIPGLERIRFATSHPKDLSEKLIDTIASLRKVCDHVHLPVQSGSDAILAAMGRGYTREHYLSLVGTLRASNPEIALTTDIIVGFPGESTEDFEATESLLRVVRFDSAFMFRYSEREGTAAAELEDGVPEKTKLDRLRRIIELQKTITGEINNGLVGRRLKVLVEGPSEKNPDVLFGRTSTAKAVVFPGSDVPGTVRSVTITRASAWTLHGTVDT